MGSEAGGYPFPMPAAPSGPSEGDAAPDLSFWQRTLLHLPRLGRRADKAPLKDRLERAFLKPVDPAKAEKSPKTPRPEDLTIEELEAAKYSDDQERLIGLSLGPLAGVIAILVTTHQLAHNPAAFLPSGRANPAHVSVALAHELELVLIALAAVILVTSLLRRRLYTGIATALYGLAIFNLHWWGFGIPFVLVGSWFLVRAYRAQQAYKTATTGDGGGRRAGGGPLPRASKRYTPPAASPKRLPPPKPGKERDAG